MKAIVIRAFGDESQLRLEEIDTPQPATDEVLIEVTHAGVGFVDTLIRQGVFDFAPLPLVPGIEVSGRIAALGSGVTGLRIGQKVAALLTDFTAGGMGGYAETARAKAALTVPLAEDDDLAIAAATIVNGATAFMALEGIAHNARVAISGASGGLGLSLIAAAVAAGASDIVAVSGRPSQHAGLIAAGATRVVAPADIAQIDHLDAAFDTVGGTLRVQLLQALQPAGHLVILGNASGEDVALPGDLIWQRNLNVEGLSTGAISHLSPERISRAARAALDAAKSNATAIEVLPLAEAGRAHRALSARQGPGKFVLQVKAN